jgi:hypothetical protein
LRLLRVVWPGGAAPGCERDQDSGRAQDEKETDVFYRGLASRRETISGEPAD